MRFKGSLGYIVSSHLKTKRKVEEDAERLFFVFLGLSCGNVEKEAGQAVMISESAQQTVSDFSQVVVVTDLKALHKRMEPATKP